MKKQRGVMTMRKAQRGKRDAAMELVKLRRLAATIVVVPTTARCRICRRILNNSQDPVGSSDCGGDCLRCMAAAGDPDCQKALSDMLAALGAKR